MFTQYIKNLIKKRSLLLKIAEANYLILKGYHPIFLDYPVNPIPRYGYEKPPHSKLYEIIDRNRMRYKNNLERFLEFEEYFWRIHLGKPITIQEPYWMNKWITGLDAVALYSFLCLNNPKMYFEIGSGESTKFARKAIRDHNLQTKITAIDPHPRTEITSICDTFICHPLEDVDLRTFDELEAEDILFIDSSHRCFMNSDVTVIFLDILPRLSAGVLVEFHDILLPYDYPLAWREWYFSEQYLLAVSLLAEGNKFDIILPNFFVSRDSELNNILAPIWGNREMYAVKRHRWSHGSSFWIQTK